MLKYDEKIKEFSIVWSLASKLNNGMVLLASGFVDDTATLANSRESTKELYYFLKVPSP